VETQNRQTGGFFIEFGSALNTLIEYLGDEEIELITSGDWLI